MGTSFWDIRLTDIGTFLSILVAVICYVWDKRRENKYATIKAYQTLQQEVFCELNRWSPSEIMEASQDKRSDGYKRLGECLAQIEIFCAGLNHNIYDFGTFYASAHGYFDRGGMLYQRLNILLEKKLEGANEDYYNNIHKVWKKMNKKSRQ